jgi:hypothetical protein
MNAMAKVNAESSVLMREALLNDAFIRTFRDTGDGDYIAARLAYRARLIPQFHWSSLQAIEKYLKCILTLNRIEARTGHDLAAALGKIRREVKFKLSISERAQQFIDHIDTFGRFRYFETPYHSVGTPLADLDRTVWEIRRYCQFIDYSPVMAPADAKKRLADELCLIEASEMHAPNRFSVHGGFLEAVLRGKKNPARPALIWKNFFFGARTRNWLSFPYGSESANSPLSLHLDIVDEFLKYVHFPADLKKAYRELAKRASPDTA